MANIQTQKGNHDLAPIIANLQWQLENCENLRQISEKADEDSKNGQILFKECEKLINDCEVDEQEVSWWS